MRNNYAAKFNCIYCKEGPCNEACQLAKNEIYKPKQSTKKKTKKKKHDLNRKTN